MKKYSFHINGTHCASCKILIESILKEQTFVQNVNVDLKNETIDIEINNEMSVGQITQTINDLIGKNGYQISTIKDFEKKSGSELIWKAIPIGIIILILFFWLQKSGILNFQVGGNITPMTSFIIGLIASVSSCLAIVGGLVLSISAKISQDKVSDTKNFILFHASRIISFAVLGGFLGIIGNKIGISFTLSSILGIIASIVMLLLGLNLVGIFEKSKITLPAFIFNSLNKIEHKTFTPILVGFSTFFLPCGFTQSMQIYALSSGSFTTGMLIMLGFVLGTFPVLLALSLGSKSFAQSKFAPLFFKTAGVIVLGLGIFTLLSGMVGLGIINPFFNL